MHPEYGYGIAWSLNIGASLSAVNECSQSEYSLCNAQTGCTARARRMLARLLAVFEAKVEVRREHDLGASALQCPSEKVLIGDGPPS